MSQIDLSENQEGTTENPPEDPSNDDSSTIKNPPEEDGGTKPADTTNDLPRLPSFLLSKDAKKEPDILSVSHSIYPTYDNLHLPYRVICRHRYYTAGLAHRRQFDREIEKHAMLQCKALEGVRLRRLFLNTILQPLEEKDIIKLTHKQQFRLDELMRN